MAPLRRLFFESFTVAAAALKQQVERPSDEPRKMPAVERSARWDALRLKFPGLDWESDSELEPAHSLVDLCFSMCEENVVKYVPWDACVRRDQELVLQRRDRHFATDSSGSLKERATTPALKADVSSDLRLELALTRRGAALHMAQVCSFDVHGKLIQRLLRERLREAPPGYSSTSLEQLLRADREIFRLISTECRTGLRPDNTGELPVDKAMLAALCNPSVSVLLLPLPGGAAKRPSDGAAGSGSKRRRGAQPSSGIHPASKGGKASGKGGKRGPRMPLKLQGMSSHDAAGSPICYNFNLEGCQGALAGASCAKGRHVCCRPNCWGDHPLSKCTR